MKKRFILTVFSILFLVNIFACAELEKFEPATVAISPIFSEPTPESRLYFYFKRWKSAQRQLYVDVGERYPLMKNLSNMNSTLDLIVMSLENMKKNLPDEKKTLIDAHIGEYNGIRRDLKILIRDDGRIPVIRKKLTRLKKKMEREVYPGKKM